MTEVTTIQTRIGRKIIVTADKSDGYVFLDVNDTRAVPDDGNRVFSMLKPGEAKKLAGALLGDNVAVITDLPEATRDGQGYVEAGASCQYDTTNPDDIEQRAKNLLAIAKFIRKANAEKEAAAEAQKAKEAEAAKAKEEAEAKLTARRDKIAGDLSGIPGYTGRTSSFKKAIDRIIELEDAAEASKYVPF